MNPHLHEAKNLKKDLTAPQKTTQRFAQSVFSNLQPRRGHEFYSGRKKAQKAQNFYNAVIPDGGDGIRDFAAQRLSHRLNTTAIASSAFIAIAKRIEGTAGSPHHGEKHS